jgi:tetratricopeptide (TPR) repeat protein
MRRLLLLSLVTLALGLAGGARSEERSVPGLYRDSYAAETRGDLSAALEAMDAVTARNGEDYVSALRKGWLQYLSGHYAEAEKAYRLAIEKEPAAVEPRLGIMLPLMALHRWKDAEANGNDVLKAAPGESTALSRLAYIQYMLGDYSASAGLYRKVLAAYPANVEMRTGLAWCLLKLQRFNDARAEFDRVLLVAPDNPSAREGRALVP